MVEEILLGGATAASLAAYAVRGKSSSLIAPSVWRGNRSKKAIALTFDDGPSESTPALLDLLDKHGVKATFFIVGQNARRLTSITKEVAASGHEIGNHTDSHPALYFKSPKFIAEQIGRAQESIAEIAGVAPAYFRAPYGVRWPGLGSAQARHGLMGVMWTAIGRDWRLPAPRIADLLLDHAENGAIFCLHDGRVLEKSPDIAATIEAVRTILPLLRDRGYCFETVSRVL